ncbi:MarR family winged helix-turn-helix transcriptional regulator [Nioella nitratireducens]|uniref:MarR family winged helix-turn-helix transcriptional regulator n=1 Tax=Nioella nitratireducens TaxID=1287720 RepID=UPI0008FD3B1D|nr:MarR family transcriptional regulator [Nioella nitratireducens]
MNHTDPHPTTPAPFRDLDPRTQAILGTFTLFTKLEARLETIHAEPEMTKTERHLLIVLSEPMRMGAIAQELQTVPSAITAVVDSLEAKGFVGRERDTEDRRAWKVHLTETGQTMRQVMANRAALLFSEAAGLPDDKTIQLARLLAEVAETDYLKSACSGEI